MPAACTSSSGTSICWAQVLLVGTMTVRAPSNHMSTASASSQSAGCSWEMKAATTCSNCTDATNFWHRVRMCNLTPSNVQISTFIYVEELKPRMCVSTAAVH